MRSTFASPFLFFVAFATIGVSIILAQTFVGGVRGLIKDPAGAVVTNATVTLTNTATGVTRTTTSSAQGEYVFSQIEPATYSITVEAPGFKKLQRSGVIIGLQENINVDITMEIGQVSESVQVTTEVPLIENATASNGQVLDQQKMVDLPNLDRNPFLLSKLSNGVIPAGDPRFNRYEDQTFSSVITISGGPLRGNNYLIDGVPITTSQNMAEMIPTLEAVQEMNMQTTTYDASIGRTGGGNTLETPAGGSTAGPYWLYRHVDATAASAFITPNPTTVITARYGFNRYPNFSHGVSQGFNPATLGLPANYTNAIQQDYFPTLSLLNNSISSSSPSWTTYWSKNANGSVSKFVGRHNITLGIDYRLVHTDGVSYTSSAGSFTFNGVFSREFPQTANHTGADFADLLMGYPSSGQVQTSEHLYEFVRYYGGYVQDDIRVNNKLTVNVGMRYEYQTGVAENNNSLAVGFNQTEINPISAGVAGVVPYGRHRIRRSKRKSDLVLQAFEDPIRA